MASYQGCLVTKTATQSIDTATDTDLTFDSEIHDVTGFHDTVTNNSRLTVPTGYDGYYQIYGLVTWAANATGYRIITIVKNGTTDLVASQKGAVDAVATSQFVTTTVYLIAGDYVELEVHQTSGGNLNVSQGSTPYYPLFGMDYLGA